MTSPIGRPTTVFGQELQIDFMKGEHTMRMMLKIKIPPESGNRALNDGTMTKAFETLNEKFNPEAAYFSMEDGMRCAYFFYDVREEYQFLEIHEPLFAAMGALVFDAPALTWEDMAKGWKALQEQ